MNRRSKLSDNRTGNSPLLAKSTSKTSIAPDHVEEQFHHMSPRKLKQANALQHHLTIMDRNKKTQVNSRDVNS